MVLFVVRVAHPSLPPFPHSLLSNRLRDVLVLVAFVVGFQLLHMIVLSKVSHVTR